MREEKDEKGVWLLKCPWCKKEILLHQRIDVGSLRKYAPKHKRSQNDKGRG